jgi:hypothetical protein
MTGIARRKISEDNIEVDFKATACAGWIKLVQLSIQWQTCSNGSRFSLRHFPGRNEDKYGKRYYVQLVSTSIQSVHLPNTGTGRYL